MTVETQYNVVKVNELREITVAQGVDELVINDLDSSPLETKKITAQNFALSIKDYILPIATDETLGGVKIGEGLTINPITGVLSNDVLVLDDLDDVIILNAEPGHVLRYNGNQWINQSEGGFTKIVAGNGLSGGGTTGEVVLHVNAGPGLSIELDAVKVNVHKGLKILDDYVEVVVNPGLTISGNAVTLVTGAGVVVDQGQVTLSLGDGLNFLGQNVQVNASQNGFRFPSGVLTLHTGVGLNYQAERLIVDQGKGLTFEGNELTIDEGKGLTFEGNELIVDLGDNLYFDDNKIDVQDATYETKGISKFAPVDKPMSEIRETDSYEKDFVNPKFVDNYAVPVGAVFFFAMRQVPDGYLFCDGSAISKTEYAPLYQAIQDVYNDGSELIDQFRLPDLRDEFLRGATTTDEVPASDTRSRVVGSKETHKVEIHAHGVSEGSFSGSVTAPGGFPTTNTSGFTWGFTMNNCSPPHRLLNDGTYEIGEGDYSYNFEDGEFQLRDMEVDPADPFNTRMCSSVTFPVSITGGGSSIGNYPPEATPVNDVDETRPRNMALLPCIKF